MLPQRFRLLQPYLASFIHSRYQRPPFKEVLYWFCQKSKNSRGYKFIEKTENDQGFKRIYFWGVKLPLFYPEEMPIVSLLQTADECFNAKNWHHYFIPEMQINNRDTILDCGSAEGLFTLVASDRAKHIYAIEPIPMWQTVLLKTFKDQHNVSVERYGLGHKNQNIRMDSSGVASKISNVGEELVDIRTIDSLFYDTPISYLKADIEGFEFPMLLGAEDTIRKFKPRIACTTYHVGNDFVEIAEFLKYANPQYNIKIRGMCSNGNPVMLFAY